MRRPPPSSGPTGVYVHLPFCRAHCSYCDFPTVIGHEDQIERYLAALICEIQTYQAELPGSTDSIYLGGGTPSRLDPEQVARVLDAVRARFVVDNCSEVTLEANPEDLSFERVRGYAEAGVTRVSLGVQTAQESVLKQVGRNHDLQQIRQALAALQQVATLQVSVDFIAGLPGDTPTAWLEGVRQLVAAPVDHVSIYLLEIDKPTPLQRQLLADRTRVADAEQLESLYREAETLMTGLGFERYEIASFARSGKQSRHNLKYWSDCWYGGFGLGAHGYFGGRRRGNLRQLPAYLESIEAGRDPLHEADPWDPLRRLQEALYAGLRPVTGLDPRELGARYGIDLLREFGEVWERLEQAGWLELRQDRLRLTPDGRLHGDAVFGEILGL